MPLNLFGQVAGPFDEIVERATSERQTSEDWELILEICDRVSHGDWQAANDCAVSLRKRMNHRDPHVVLQALCVVDSCVSNCGRRFKEQACSKEFLAELKSKATGSNRVVAEKTRTLIRRWCEEESSNGSMEAMRTLYSDLKRDGYDFPNPKERAKPSGGFDINVFKKEEEDLAKAIQLSLRDQQSCAVTQKIDYALPEGTNRTTVKALYDFEAAEDNELSFQAGEFITITDDSDANWWRGSSHRGEGLFPASFVTHDLGAPVQRNKSKKSVTFNENVTVAAAIQPKKSTEIDETKFDRCLMLLQETDPTGERADPIELLQLEMECSSMGDLIEKELAVIDQEHNRLAEVNVRLMEAINSYHMSMNDYTVPVGQQQVSTYLPSRPSQDYVQPAQYVPVNKGATEIAPMPTTGSAGPSALTPM